MILIVSLALPGIAGVGWGHLRQRSVAAEIVNARRIIANAPSAEEYLMLYEEWSQLPPAQKAENPWGHGRYGGFEIQKRLREHQYERLAADMAELIAGVKSYPPQLAEVLYGADWNERLSQFQRQQELRNVVMICAMVCVSAAGVLTVAGLLKFAVTLLWRKCTDRTDEVGEKSAPAKCTKAPDPLRQPKAAASPSPDVGTQNNSSESHKKTPSPDPVSGGGYFRSFADRQTAAKPAVLPQTSAALIAAATRKDAVDTYFGWASDAQQEETPVTLMTTEPVSRGLSELTEEVSAIRQYAAAQQDQMRKLQDGYDWMIIRRFCMRIIRCIDNIDDRIAKLGDRQPDVCACLEDIRDELVIALESSGIEQYQPDLNVPFKGLEKYAEAVRQRVAAPNPALVGAIAEIVRPGYQYLINDDDVKIVRCAQVKLYDAAETNS